jgi:hypothetical protein
MNLYEANQQWANRPDDERFENLQQMLAATKAYADAARTALVPFNSLRLEADGGDLKLIGKANVPAKLTNFAFGQMARWAKAPAEYLRRLPATLAAQNVNYGLKTAADERDEDKLSLLLHENSGSLIARAVTSDNYDRVWNYELVERIQRHLSPEGWVTPPARPARQGQKGTRKAVAADILPNQKDFGLAIKLGDEIAPAGLYASDHDMFAFLVNQIDPVFDGQKYLNRGVFIQNSEVGDCSLRFKLFTYDNVCGNHIVWGVGKVAEVVVRHVKGEEVRRGNTLKNALSKWHMMAAALPSPGTIESDIKKAQAYEIADSKEDVLDAVFKFAKVKGLTRLNKPTLEAAYDIAEATPRYGAPTTVWGMVNGLTEYSQTSPYTDDRTELDVQAGRVMEMAF